MLFGQSSTGSDATFNVTLNTDGSITTLGGILPPGDWTFDVYNLNHGGNPTKVVATVDVVLE